MMKTTTNAAAKPSILRQIAEIERMSLAELRTRWREIFAVTDVPGYSAAHLRRRLAYRLQELRWGGIAPATREKLAKMAEGLDVGNGTGLKRRRHDESIVAGTRLIREWNGKRYEVTVVADGFEFDGRPFRSLSAVAQVITKQHWNGPLFFGLRAAARKKEV